MNEMVSKNDSVLIGSYVKSHGIDALLEKGYRVHEFSDKINSYPKNASSIVGIIVAPCNISSLTDELICSLPNLKVISVVGAGIDGLNIDIIHKRNIRISNLPHITAEPTADMAILLMLATARKLKEAIRLAEQSTVKEDSGLFKLIGRNVTGATIGILGMGSIGYCIAQRAVGFRMEILYHSRTRRSKLDEERVNARYINSLDELLNLADFLVITVPLTQETNNLIGKKELLKMKPTSILINVARGRIVDTNDLVEALENGTISAAGLDVTEPEPLPRDHPLYQMDNVILSGHSGTSTIECHNELFQQAIHNLKAGLTGGVMSNEILPKF